MQRGSLNKALIIGHLGQDPEPRYTPSGTAVVNISVATNEVTRDSDGNDKELTEWHRVVLWGKQAEFVGNYVKKGQLVFIEGRLQTRSWEDRNQVKRQTTEIVANTITLLGGTGSGRATGAPAEEPSPETQAPPDDDDIPF